MNPEKDLDYYKKLRYDVILKKKGVRYLVFIPELSLVEEDEQLEKAHDKLEKAKEKYFRDTFEMGYQDYIREPDKLDGMNNDFYGLKPFFIRFSIVLAVLLVFLSFTSIAVLNTAPKLIKSRIKSVMNEPERYLLRFNEIMEDKTDEQKEAIKRNLRRAAENIKPYADELNILFEDNNPGTEKTGPDR